jgi:RNA polymerase sigma-70 factor (ECF subfamily)
MVNERELLVRIRNADQRAFKQLFDLYVHKVYQFVFNYIKDRQDSEDIVQLVFQKLWVKRETINIDKSFTGFLFTIAYRSVIDHIRHVKSRKQFNIGHFMDHEEPACDSTAEYLLTHHYVESAYQDAINSLTPKRKEIFLLSRHEGLANKEIAEKLQLSIKTVENHMTAALFTLREFLKRAEISAILICSLLLH